MKTVYLDTEQSVIASSTKLRTLEVAQSVNPDIVQVIPSAPDEIVIKSDSDQYNLYYHKLTSGDGTLLSHYTETPRLEGYRAEKITAISTRTLELLALGFQYNDRRFSLDSSCISTYLSLSAIDLKNAVSFPLPIQDVTREMYSLPNRKALHTFLAYASAGLVEVQEGDLALRNSINMADTQSAIDAVTDTRIPLEIPNTALITIEDYTADTTHRIEDKEETSTTSTSPKQRLVLNVEDIAEKSKWYLKWSFEMKSSKKSSVAYTQVNFDGVEVAADHLWGENWKTSTGSLPIVLSGRHTFDISYWAKQSKYPTYIRRLNLQITRNNED